MKSSDIKSILVPIDFSDLSIGAIPLAKQLGRQFGATVHLGNVQEPYYPPVFYGMGVQPPLVVTETIETGCRNAMARLKALGREWRLSGRMESVVGAPVFAEICAIARRVAADLIVTSTHGHTGFKHLFLGSTAERLVQHSPCPVWVVRSKKKRSIGDKAAQGKIDTILAPIDFSACSLAGATYAVRMAKRFSAKLIFLHVIDLGSDAYGIYELSQYKDMLERDAKKKITAFLRPFSSGRTGYETRVVTGTPVDLICRVARKENVDLIVTATHGRTGVKHAVIGSTAEVVVRHSPCSVLVVPSHPVERRKRLKAMPKQEAFPMKKLKVRNGAVKRKPRKRD